MDSLYDAVHALFSEGELPTSPVVHAVLLRLCADQRAELHNRLREPGWRRKQAAFRLALAEAESAEPSSLVPAIRDLLLERRPQPLAQLLIACAAALQSLDRFHKDRRAAVERRSFELPLPGRPSTTFLAPPARPIEGLVAAADKLVRGISDYRGDLRGELGLWWYLVPLDRHEVMPRYRELDADVSATLEDRLERLEDLSVGLASPFADLGFRIESDTDRRDQQGKTPYRFVGLDPEHRGAARKALERIVATCAAREVDVLCFPELTLDNALLRELAQLLELHNAGEHPALVMAGSFHLEGDKCWHNRGTILDGFGRTLFDQCKCGDFRIPPERAAGMGENGRRLLGIDERGGYEDIDVGTELRVVDTPLGRLVTPICRDYLDDQLGELLVGSAVNLCLVPAMTEKMLPFHQRAEYLGTRTRGVSFAINSTWLLRQLGIEGENAEGLRVMGYLPRRHGLKTAGEWIDECPDLCLFTIRVLLS